MFGKQFFNVGLHWRQSLACALVTLGFAGIAQAQTGNVAAGETLYNNNCFVCHGAPRTSNAAAATSVEVLNNALNSVNQMQFMRAMLTQTDRNNIVAYIVSQVSGPVLQSQTITFPTIATFAWNSIGVPLAATASSQLPISYSVQGACLLSGTRLIGTGIGTCTVTASQVGNATFSAAQPVSRQVTLTMIGLAKRGGVDIDGDNRGEIVLRNAQGATMLGRLSATTGQFVFTATTDPGIGFRYVGLVDFGNNGRTDLAIQDVTQGEFGEVFVVNELVPATRLLMRTVKRVWDVQAVGDLDGDGVGDLVWRYLGFTPERPGDTGVSYIWFANAGGGVPAVRKRGGAPLDWQLLGAADLNGDGRADMVYISPANQIRVLMATDLRTCANFAAGVIPAGFSALKLADFTANGRAEILIRNATTGEVRLLALDATSVTLPPFTANPDDPDANCTATTVAIANSISNLPNTDPAWRFYAADDLDGDGRFDIVWRQADGTLTLWRMNGSFTPSVTLNAGSAPSGFQPNATTPASSPAF